MFSHVTHFYHFKKYFEMANNFISEILILLMENICNHFCCGFFNTVITLEYRHVGIEIDMS